MSNGVAKCDVCGRAATHKHMNGSIDLCNTHEIGWNKGRSVAKMKSRASKRVGVMRKINR